MDKKFTGVSEKVTQERLATMKRVGKKVNASGILKARHMQFKPRGKDYSTAMETIINEHKKK